MKISPNESCPCESGKKYKKCCRRYHNGMKIPTPTDLVRARWSAYALKLPDFIMQTTHPDNPDYDANFAKWRVRVEAYCLRNIFHKLEIVSAEDDKVTYRAEILAFMSQPTAITEDSVFAQKDGDWLYLDGELDTEESEIKDA
ncbi:MAG: YchJ family metal-binding protein [Chloroflexota bacterium]